MLRLHHLALVTLTLSFSACGGRVVQDVGDASIDDASTLPSEAGGCCPIASAPFSCSCINAGGSPPCRKVCDGGDFVMSADKNGCPVLSPRKSCYPPKPPPDSGPPPDGTVGKTCATEYDCDITGAGITFCSNALFVLGTINPTPICIGIECDPGPGTGVTKCDAGHGVCVDTSASGSGICFPFCSFDGGGAPPVGCVGKNACTPYRWSIDPSGIVTGTGLCIGGCRSDSDCTAGDKCQIEQGYCVKKLDAYVLKPGEVCTKADATSKPAKCNCAYSSSTGTGYCTLTCRVGIDTCPTGLTCDPQLPKSDFAAAPKSISGSCLPNCASDTDCKGAGKCLESVGTGQKTCQPGLTF